MCFSYLSFLLQTWIAITSDLGISSSSNHCVVRYSQRGSSRGRGGGGGGGGGGFSRGRGGARGRGRGRGRGGRSENKATPTLEELNAQLDAYNSKVIILFLLFITFRLMTLDAKKRRLFTIFVVLFKPLPLFFSKYS